MTMMKNLSAYVTYEDFLKFEKAAIEFENSMRLKRARRGYYSLLIRLMFYTGARIGEIVGIKVKDVIFRDRLIAIYGKSTNSRDLKPRTVIVDQKTMNMIKEHIEKYSLKPNDKIINLNENGAKILIDKLKNKVGLPWVTCHKLDMDMQYMRKK